MKRFRLGACLVGMMAVSANASVRVETVRQNWPWDTRVEVTYTVESGFWDLSPQLVFGETKVPVTLPTTLPFPVSGDLYGVGPGRQTFGFDAAQVRFPENLERPVDWKGVTVSFEAKETAYPKYLVVDLTTTPYTLSSLGAVPDGGWGDVYKTDKIVFARIPVNGGVTFQLGAPASEFLTAQKYEEQKTATLTNDYYLAIFEVTQKQWERVMGALPAGIDAKNEGAAKPVSNITYVDLVGAAQDAQKYGWPYSSKVAEESFVGRLRAKTTLPAGFAAGYKFYLPTDAQWEYACRGGVETTWPNGTSFTAGSLKTKPQVAGYAGQYDDNLNRFAWHRANSNDRAQIVGTRCPNAFGVYDLLGNVSEWGLCYSLASPCPGGVEPTGDRSYAASTAPLRSLRGGNFASFVFSASTYTKYQQTNLQMDPASAGNYGLLSQRPAFHVRATWDFKHDFVGARLALVHTSVKE